MATSQAVVDVLNETIEAFAVFDLECLQILEERASALAQSNFVVDKAGMTAILSKKRVLEQVLHDSIFHLKAFHRLYGRVKSDPWEH
jgi:hypothetical protein